MSTILYFVLSAINLLEILILVASLLTWFVQGRGNEIINLLRAITNPILEPFQRLQDKLLGNIAIDISPVLAIVALEIIKRFIYIKF